ncbi:MAG: 6,7-dimethyl-8-ribityllumazine synthase [Euryhalocaulis sp.]|uniref:6,7-dimethyl-8-ribityllumazine synthase n=1 Tax=Euryhalocaulis sp. TaxID=2744307 RepID=UPI00183CD4E9|nr:6,7-dimethyl-8-ribityllumazine synthase [Euryhalocaulis sp.]MBA4802085.1 6,7-dimethyl-8-ribityllumazine synthase [Euryhalocaulis sp.]
MAEPRLLIVEARFYGDVADALYDGAAAALDKAGASHERIDVPGAFEIPGVIAAAADSDRYDGFVALGCVIRGETSHYDYICQETARALMDLSLIGVPLGNGILTVESMSQAMERAMPDRKNKGADAANAALRMIELKAKFEDE